MATEYTILYGGIPSVTFPTASGMRSYLAEENVTYERFLKTLSESAWLAGIEANHGHSNMNGLAFANSFPKLEISEQDSDRFNNMFQGWQRSSWPPPPSSSLVGQLILGLHENGHPEESVRVYLSFLKDNGSISATSNAQMKAAIEQGRSMILAAFATEALPFRKVTSSRMSAAARTAETFSQSLLDEVKASEQINRDHKANLNRLSDIWKRNARRVRKLLISREKHRSNQHIKWLALAEQVAKNQADKSELRMLKISKATFKRLKTQNEEFERLKDLFSTQLRLRAPVALWKERSVTHGAASKNAFKTFLVFSGVAILIAVCVPYFFGDYISSSFREQVCILNFMKLSICASAFSAKGPLTISGLLLITSLLLWMIRLQYRLHLSERHLALDASERQAFAETYMAMKEGQHVGAENEGILLTSLFRPTQDGIIRDDESGVDFSTAALIARQLGR